MVTELNWGQVGLYIGAIVVVNGILLRTAGYYIKKWMENTDAVAKQTATDLAMVAKDTATELAKSTLEYSKSLAESNVESRKELATATAAIALDIKTDLREHREDDRIRLEDIKRGIETNKGEYIRVGGEIKTSVDTLAKHQREANGRTGKLEGKLDTQIGVCQQIQVDKNRK